MLRTPAFNKNEAEKANKRNAIGVPLRVELTSHPACLEFVVAAFMKMSPLTCCDRKTKCFSRCRLKSSSQEPCMVFKMPVEPVCKF